MSLHWDTPSGQVLAKLVAVLPKGTELVVFGSGALELQLTLPRVTKDLDVFSYNLEEDRLEQVASAARVTEPPFIEVVSKHVFKASRRWEDRATKVGLEGTTVILPHPVDILLSKIVRMEDKDLEDFRHVINVTGHPTEAEFKQELINASDLLRRDPFDEEQGHNPANNVKFVWHEIYGKEIDPVREILRPVHEAIKKMATFPNHRQRIEEFVSRLLAE